jgi:flagellar hook-associated protein 2
VSKINAADLGVRASYDSNYNRFFLNTDSTGNAATINISSDSANFLGSGTNSSVLQLNINVGTSYNGQNAAFNIGDAVGMESATNHVAVNGLSLNLVNTGITTVTVNQDTDTMVASVKAFVEAYNETLDKLYDKLTQKRNLDYKPLTDAQKKDMSDKEVEQWETKARSGLLRSDPTLQKIVTDLRTTLTRVVSELNGSFDTLSEIGITTGQYSENGKIHLDVDKLKQALADDADGVIELFTHSSTVAAEQGIGASLYSTVADGIRYLSDKAGSSSSLTAVDNSYIGKRLLELKDRIDDWEDRLEKIKERYYRKFTAMEEAINSMNSQSAWINAQFFSTSG